MKKLLYLILIIAHPITAEAYIGPGMGAGPIVVVLGILSAIFLVFIAIVWYPLKRLFKLIFKKEEDTAEIDSESSESS